MRLKTFETQNHVEIDLLQKKYEHLGFFLICHCLFPGITKNINTPVL